ncbi:MAG: PilT/PilU family type 4a pilus ATPase [Gammaproteobacteria bacterium]|nr:PilT/PilU family type 4a pilus ATPase [Gammaproteobacteria bacterium]
MVIEHVNTLLEDMVTRRASDLYLTYDSPAALRINDNIVAVNRFALKDEDIQRYISQLLTPEQQDEFHSTFELNMALNFNDAARFRVNVFRQQAHHGIVIRRIENNIPSLESLKLPPVYGELAMLKRGLILVSGQTGSGKSTSLAAMVGFRNTHGQGHIITVEDPIEFVHQHHKCIVTQRDVGLDTYSYALALKNALRQRPDLVVIGEVRDREVMEQAIYFAETGHLCIATIHANNASQTIERVINFFPEDRHPQILLNLSLNLRATLSQRLMRTQDGGRTLALEIMLNRGLIRQHIELGKIRQLREMIEKGASDGMQTFDQHLFSLYQSRVISEEVALAESDSLANLRMQIQNDKALDRDFNISLRTSQPMPVEQAKAEKSDF